MLNATLTYLDRLQEPVATFVLDCPETIVGRDPLAAWLVQHYESGNGFLEVRNLLDLPEVVKDARNRPEVVKRVRGQEPFQVRVSDTLFVGMPWDTRLARRHFSIRRTADVCGEVVFSVRDLQSHCGFMVNGVGNPGNGELPLKDGDRISYGFEFVFHLVRDVAP